MRRAPISEIEIELGRGGVARCSTSRSASPPTCRCWSSRAARPSVATRSSPASATRRRAPGTSRSRERPPARRSRRRSPNACTDQAQRGGACALPRATPNGSTSCASACAGCAPASRSPRTSCPRGRSRRCARTRAGRSTPSGPAATSTCSRARRCRRRSPTSSGRPARRPQAPPRSGTSRGAPRRRRGRRCHGPRLCRVRDGSRVSCSGGARRPADVGRPAAPRGRRGVRRRVLERRAGGSRGRRGPRARGRRRAPRGPHRGRRSCATPPSSSRQSFPRSARVLPRRARQAAARRWARWTTPRSRRASPRRSPARGALRRRDPGMVGRARATPRRARGELGGLRRRPAVLDPLTTVADDPGPYRAAGCPARMRRRSGRAAPASRRRAASRGGARPTATSGRVRLDDAPAAPDVPVVVLFHGLEVTRRRTTRTLMRAASGALAERGAPLPQLRGAQPQAAPTAWATTRRSARCSPPCASASAANAIRGRRIARRLGILNWLGRAGADASAFVARGAVSSPIHLPPAGRCALDRGANRIYAFLFLKSLSQRARARRSAFRTASTPRASGDSRRCDRSTMRSPRRCAGSRTRSTLDARRRSPESPASRSRRSS